MKKIILYIGLSLSIFTINSCSKTDVQTSKNNNIAKVQPPHWIKVGRSLGTWRPEGGSLAFTNDGKPIVAFTDVEIAQKCPDPEYAFAPVYGQKAVVCEFNGEKWRRKGHWLGKYTVDSPRVAVSPSGKVNLTYNDCGFNGTQPADSYVYKYGWFGWSEIGVFHPKYILDILDTLFKPDNTFFILTSQIFSLNDKNKVIVYKKHHSSWQQVGNIISHGETFPGEIKTDRHNDLYISVIQKAGYSNLDDGLIYIGTGTIYKLQQNKWIQIGSDISKNARSVSFGFGKHNRLYAVVYNIYLQNYKGYQRPVGDDITVYRLIKDHWQKLGNTFGDGKHFLVESKPKLTVSESGKIYLAFSEKLDDQGKESRIIVYSFDPQAEKWKQVGQMLGAEQSSLLDFSINKFGTLYVLFLNAYNRGYNQSDCKVVLYKFST